MVNDQWIYDTPALSDVEAKLRRLLLEMGNDNKILGVQVCTVSRTLSSDNLI